MSTFDWCAHGQHEACAREFNRHYFDPRTKKTVVTDEVVRCECPKRGCKCYVRKADRTRAKVRR